MEHAETKSECRNNKTKQIWGNGKSLLTCTDRHNMARGNFNLLQSAEGRLLMGDTTKLKEPRSSRCLRIAWVPGNFLGCPKITLEVMLSSLSNMGRCSQVKKRKKSLSFKKAIDKAFKEELLEKKGIDGINEDRVPKTQTLGEEACLQCRESSGVMFRPAHIFSPLCEPIEQ